MNYKQKIREVKVKIDLYNKVIHSMEEPPMTIMEEIRCLEDRYHYLLEKYYEKSQGIRLAIVAFFQAVFIFCILITIIKFIIEN